MENVRTKLTESERIERAEAMLGLYYHLLRGSEGYQLPSQLEPLPSYFAPPSLESAADVIGKFTDGAAILRQRRAVATMVETGYNTKSDFEALLRRMKVDDEKIAVLLRNKEITINAVYALFGPMGCTCENVTQDIKRRPGFPFVVEARVSAETNRPFQDVCESLDPQNWAKCSDYFAKVYAAKKVDGGYPGNGEFDAQVGPDPGNPGHPWQDTCFEHFWVPFGGLAWFRNYLEITTTKPSADRYVVTYDLRRAIGSRVLVSRIDGGVDVDSGRIVIDRRDDGGAKVIMEKDIRFTDRTPLDTSPAPDFDLGEILNYLSSFVMRAQLDETVCDNICCG